MPKEDLEKMLDAVVNSNNDEAEQHFHTFVQQKMKEVLHGNKDKEVETTTNKETE